MKLSLTTIFSFLVIFANAQNYNNSIRTTSFDNPSWEPYNFSMISGNESTVAISCGTYKDYTAQVWYQDYDGASFFVLTDKDGLVVASKKISVSSINNNTIPCPASQSYCPHFSIKSLIQEDCSTLIFTGLTNVVKSGSIWSSSLRTVYGRIFLGSSITIQAEMMDFQQPIPPPNITFNHGGEEVIFIDGKKYLVANEYDHSLNIIPSFFINEIYGASASNVHYEANLFVRDVTHSSFPNEMIIAGFSGNNPLTTGGCGAPFYNTIDVLRIDLNSNIILQRESFTHDHLNFENIQIEYDPTSNMYVVLTLEQITSRSSELILFRLDDNLRLVDIKNLSYVTSKRHVHDFDLKINPQIDQDYHISFIYGEKNGGNKSIRYLRLDNQLGKVVDKAIIHPDGDYFFETISSALRNSDEDGAEIVYSIGNSTFKYPNTSFYPQVPINNPNDPWEMLYTVATSTEFIDPDNCEEPTDLVLNNICVTQLDQTDPTNNVIIRPNVDQTVNEDISEVFGTIYNCYGHQSEIGSTLRKSNRKLDEELEIDEMQISEERAIKIYPNPSEGVLYISSKEKLSRVSIYDLNGKLIEEFRQMEQNRIELPEQKGFYLLRIQTESGELIQKKVIRN